MKTLILLTFYPMWKFDRLRYKIYGKHPQIFEGIIKTTLLFIALWLRFY